MPTLTMIGGDEEPYSRAEQHEYDLKFEAFVAQYIGDALLSPTRIQAQKDAMSGTNEIFVAIDVPEDEAG